MERVKTSNVILFAVIAVSIVAMMGWVFWEQEVQYWQPTPIPVNFVDVKVGDTVDLAADLPIAENRPAFLHFFNFDCPCSRFNMEEFERMAHKYRGQIDFFVVIQSEDENAVEHFNSKYELNIPAIADKGGIISDKCGIYATPQAVILDKNSTIFFKGNYNKARYCTKKETKFAEIALGYLLKNKALPLSMQYEMTEPYGCSLPADESTAQSQNSFKLF